MNLKLAILPLFLGVGLSSVYLLPQAGTIAASAIKMKLPSFQTGWEFEKTEPSEAELKTLSPDTEFSKAICYAARPGEYNDSGQAIPDRLDLSVVLSGYDLNNSIHRPERCMRAQGHLIFSESTVPINLANGRNFGVRRLVSSQSLPNKDEKKAPQQLKCVTYYFFVGHDRVEYDHNRRTFIDMWDRVVRGRDQRWAYVLVSMWYGKMPWNPNVEITESEADAKVVKFLTDFSERQISWKQIAP